LRLCSASLRGHVLLPASSLAPATGRLIPDLPAAVRHKARTQGPASVFHVFGGPFAGRVRAVCERRQCGFRPETSESLVFSAITVCRPRSNDARIARRHDGPCPRVPRLTRTCAGSGHGSPACVRRKAGTKSDWPPKRAWIARTPMAWRTGAATSRSSSCARSPRRSASHRPISSPTSDDRVLSSFVALGLQFPCNPRRGFPRV